MAILSILVLRIIIYTNFLGYTKIGGYVFFTSLIMAFSSLVIMNSMKNALLLRKFIFIVQYVIACTIISSIYQLLLEFDFSNASLIIKQKFALFSIASIVSLGLYELIQWIFRTRRINESI